MVGDGGEEALGDNTFFFFWHEEASGKQTVV